MPVYLSIAHAGEAGHDPLTWSELQALPLPPPGERIAYGKSPQQFGELRVPAGAGPFPVVIVIHGGCWLADFDFRYITRVSAALTQAGYATWTPEFRRLGDSEGGWPNTLLDVARAADQLRMLAARHPLDLKRVVAIGHSSGGQLALWLAARHKLPTDSPLYLASPLPLAGAVGLAAITDLATYREGPTDSCNASVDRLLGGTPSTQPQRYAQASPRALLPLGVPQYLIQGEEDGIVPPESARTYAEAGKTAGDAVVLEEIPGAGHFDMVVPGNAAWSALTRVLAQFTHH